MILNEIKKPEQIAQAFQFIIKSIFSTNQTDN